MERPAPTGLLRLCLRLPIWLYRLRCGWVLNSRFLLLTHSGRRSGLPRQTVLEVVHYDRATETYVIASGWGEKPDWRSEDTRLNSSHLGISYAVFCLKKKKN